ncbi:hypothetical protein BSIN_0529 [Burkholderia singularis]|uniref:Uncharacterized protein n=1 Tax=Burkholderia singularis TaxID=1503053 RepID=A0A238H8A8_9BURK|nr:hypothetical protein BSIN_0529 [Burkholderia singularis]
MSKFSDDVLGMGERFIGARGSVSLIQAIDAALAGERRRAVYAVRARRAGDVSLS